MFIKISDFSNKYKKIITIVSILIYVILTIIGISTHEAWCDESQAWLISQDLNFFELVQYLKYEGHLFVWYVLLMPFSKFNLFYPISMLILNLLITWGAVYILWKEAPFNIIFKVLITFSVPIAYQYVVIARPYSTGILLLFILTALYKKKLQHPVIYSILLFFGANTSVLTLFGAFAFGILFCINYIKNKKLFWKEKEFYCILFIFALTVFIVLYQIFLSKEMSSYFDMGKIYCIEGLVNGLFKYESSLIFSGIITFIYLALGIGTFYKNKSVLFFYICTYSLQLLLEAFYYNGTYWHHYFYFIYFVISLWLFKNAKTEHNKFYNLLIIFFICSLISLNIVTLKDYKFDIFDKYSYAKDVALKIKSDKDILSGNIVFCDGETTGVIPYLRTYGINAYECRTKGKASFWHLGNNKSFYVSSDDIVKKNFEMFENKPIYLVTLYDEETKPQSNDYKLIEYYSFNPEYYDTPQGIRIVKLIPKHD